MSVDHLDFMAAHDRERLKRIVHQQTVMSVAGEPDNDTTFLLRLLSMLLVKLEHESILNE